MFLLNYETLIDPLLRDLRLFLSEFGGLKAGEKVLDVCCGTGVQAIEYARRGIIATGIDLDTAMLKTAERKRSESGLSNLEFRLADAASLPFAGGSFDAASISLALHGKTADVREKVVAEMQRVVKQGGILLFADFNAPLPGNFDTFVLNSIEYIAGREHYRNSRDYLDSGGLGRILARHNIVAGKTDYLKNGNFLLIKARNPGQYWPAQLSCDVIRQGLQTQIPHS